MNRRPDDVPRGHRGTSPNPAPLALLPPNPTAVGTKCCSRLTLRRNTLRTGQVPLGDHRGSAVIAMAALGAVFANLGSAGPDTALNPGAPQATAQPATTT